MWAKILKVIAAAAKSAAKVTVKIGKKVADKAIVKSMQTVGKTIVKHPKIAAGVIAALEGVRAIQDCRGEWSNELKDDKLVDNLAKDVEALKTVDVNSVSVETPNKQAPSGQHPTFYFKESDKYSIQTTDDLGMGDNTRFRYGAFRHLTIGKPILAGEKDFTEMVVPDTTAEMMFEAYNSFYARLGTTGNKSKGVLTDELSRILYYSSLAYALLKDAKRFYSAKNVTFNGDSNAVYYMIGGNFTTLATKLGSVPILKGCGYDNFDQLGLKYAPVYKDITSYTVDASDYDAYYPNVSGVKWMDLVSKLKKLPISDNTAGFWDYFLEGVFRDAIDEDEYEYYTFHPCQFSDLGGSTIPIADKSSSPNNFTMKSWVEQFEKCYNTVVSLINSEKAYTAMLAYFGLIPTSSGVKPAFQTKWRDNEDKFNRDSMGKSIMFVDATDDLYRSLCNAKYFVKIKDEADKLRDAWADFRQQQMAVSTDPAGFGIAFGSRKKLVPGYQSKEVYPTLTTVNAGELASAIKFAGPMVLYVGPVAFYNLDVKFRFKDPAVRSWAAKVPQGSNITIEGSIDLNNTIAYDIADFAQDGVLPLYLREYAYLYPDAEASKIQYVYRPTHQFDVVRPVDNAEPIFKYLYTNMLLGTDQLKDSNEVLNKLVVYYGVNV